jgi:hypothetical protein
MSDRRRVELCSLRSSAKSRRLLRSHYLPLMPALFIS